VDPVLETHGWSIYTNNYELAIANLIACLLIFNIINILGNGNAIVYPRCNDYSTLTDQTNHKLLNRIENHI
jgi:hypothetical protein